MGVRRNKNSLVAVKRLRLGSSKSCQQPEDVSLRLIENEIAIMRQLLHPHILEISAAFVQGPDVFVVSPLHRFGSCQDVMDRFCCVGFPELIVSLIGRDVLLAIDYLHRKGYIHRSIRASHILLDDRAVLTGFKECVNLVVDGQRIRRLFELPTSPKELVWLAPEVLAQNLIGYTEKSDIYSFGIALCELANNLTPFKEMTTTLMLVEKARGNHPALLDCSTYAVEQMEGLNEQEAKNFALATRQVYSQRKLTDAFHDFVETCLRSEPAKRPSADKLLQHPFVRQSKHTTLRLELDELKIDSIDAIVPPNAIADTLSSSLGDMKISSESDDFSWNF